MPKGAANSYVNRKDSYTKGIKSTAKDTSGGASLDTGYKTVKAPGMSPRAKSRDQ